MNGSDCYIMDGYYIKAPGTDPCVNLAVEEYLVKRNEVLNAAILILWKNHNTVVIGKNQNAYAECDLEYARINGIKVVRRITGGGAVYHDDGNINYSIIVPIGLHNIDISTALMTDALKSLGIDAVKDGRNDICLDGLKISGNAYYTDKYTGLHHGTLLYRVDSDRMDRVLSVSADKLKRKGIKSVRSRVGDIVTRYPGIEQREIEEAIKASFMNTYRIDELKDLNIAEGDIEELIAKYRSKAWNIDKVGKDEEGSDEL